MILRVFIDKCFVSVELNNVEWAGWTNGVKFEMILVISCGSVVVSRMKPEMRRFSLLRLV